MAVHTKLTDDELAHAVARYDIGHLIAASPIETGIENSNYRIETNRGTYVLTLFEKRVDPEDLPFFAELLQQLARSGCPVPPPISGREGRIQTIAGKPAWLVPFLNGQSPFPPTAVAARRTGEALAQIHRSADGLTETRTNDLSLKGWHRIADELGDRVEAIAPELRAEIDTELNHLDRHWPRDLPKATIHADLFPDNVLMTGDEVTGIIDFYFSCTDIRAYDLAVTHASWAFTEGGRKFEPDIGTALIEGYAETHPLSSSERRALPILCRGACLRFLLTRAVDWFADGEVHRKDPLGFARRLEFYRAAPDRLFVR